MAAILDIGTERVKQIWIFMLPRCLPSSFSSIQLSSRKALQFEWFQDGRHGSHSGYPNEHIFAVLSLHVASMPPTKFQLNRTCGSGGDTENVKRDGRPDGRRTDDRQQARSKWLVPKLYKRRTRNQSKGKASTVLTISSKNDISIRNVITDTSMVTLMISVFLTSISA